MCPPEGKDKQWRIAFQHDKQLASDFVHICDQWFDPLVEDIAQAASTHSGPMLVSITGCQGSGKSTLASYLVAALHHQWQISSTSLSLDDVYLTRAERNELASNIHPLLATRGAPGTHDLELLRAVLADLMNEHFTPTRIPAFDKSTDDRRPHHHWPHIDTAPKVVMLEGWCMGAAPQPTHLLATAVNDLERQEDADGTWRAYVNNALENYQPIYHQAHYTIMLAAPGFDCVARWRLEQEEQLQVAHPTGSAVMNATQIERFVQHYQRITEHCLETLPDTVDYLFTLDQQRRIVNAENRREIRQ